MSDPSRSTTLVLLTLACVTLLPACYDWHVTEVGPSRYIPNEQPAIVRLTLRDGNAIDILNPSMVGGSVVGVLGTRGRGRQMVDSTVSVPVDDVAQVEVREISMLRTGVTVTAIGGALLLTIGRVFSNWVHR